MARLPTIVAPQLLCGTPIVDECARQMAVSLFCGAYDIPDGPQRLAVKLASKLDVAKANAARPERTP